MRSKAQILDGDDEFLFTARCQTDFMFFSARVLGYNFSRFHEEQAMQLFTRKHVCIINPRGHSKTTLYTIAYAIWRAWRNDGRIGLFSSALSQSIKNLAIIKEHLTNNEYLSFLVPLDQSITWSKTKLVCTNGSSISVLTFNPSSRGEHLEYVIADDILREEDISQSEIKDKFWNIVYPTVRTTKGQIIVVGTPMSEDDLLHELEAKSKESDTEWFGSRHSAVITAPDGTWLAPLWPEMFTLDELRKMKSDMGDYRFNKEYMCQVRSDSTSFYPYSMVAACIDPTLGFSDKIDGECYISADFAMSDGARADYTVITVVDSICGTYEKSVKLQDQAGNWVWTKIPVKNPVIIRRIERMKGVGFQNQIIRIHALYDLYHPVRIILDSSNFGRAFTEELRRRCLPVSEQDFSYKNRNTLLVQLRKMIEPQDPSEKYTARLVIPGKTEDSQAGYLSDILLQEMSAMQEGVTDTGIRSVKSRIEHDDMVFSAALCIRDVSSPRQFISMFQSAKLW